MATVQEISDRVREIINDPDKARVSDATLYRHASDALDLMCKAMPSLFTKRGTHTTTAGSLQTLILTRAAAFVRAIALTPFDKATLDAFLPSWQTGTAGTAAQWAPADNPKTFYIYPPQAVSQSISVDYVEAPAEFTALSDSLPVSDDFVNPIADFVIGMCESKEEDGVNSTRAALFMQTFATKLGLKKG